MSLEGVASLAYFSEDDSGESSNQEEDDDSEAAETDEPGNEELNFLDEQPLERRGSGTAQGSRASLAPQAMQWAVRPRDANVRSTTANPSSGTSASSGGLIYIDPSSLRRASTVTTSVTAAATQEPVTMATTASCLARAFGIVIRQIADLLTMLQDYHALAPNLPCILDVSYSESISLQLYLEYHLKPTWDWLLTVMDSTEAQLRFGSALSNALDPSHPSHPLHSQNTRTGRGERVRDNQTHVLDGRRRGRLTSPGLFSKL